MGVVVAAAGGGGEGGCDGVGEWRGLQIFLLVYDEIFQPFSEPWRIF